MSTFIWYPKFIHRTSIPSVSLSSLDSEEQESLRAAERLHNRSSRNSTGGISTHSLNEAELAVGINIFLLKKEIWFYFHRMSRDSMYCSMGCYFCLKSYKKNTTTFIIAFCSRFFTNSIYCCIFFSDQLFTTAELYESQGVHYTIHTLITFCWIRIH